MPKLAPVFEGIKTIFTSTAGSIMGATGISGMIARGVTSLGASLLLQKLLRKTPSTTPDNRVDRYGLQGQVIDANAPIPAYFFTNDVEYHLPPIIDYTDRIIVDKTAGTTAIITGDTPYIKLRYCNIYGGGMIDTTKETYIAQSIDDKVSRKYKIIPFSSSFNWSILNNKSLKDYFVCTTTSSITNHTQTGPGNILNYYGGFVACVNNNPKKEHEYRMVDVYLVPCFIKQSVVTAGDGKISAKNLKLERAKNKNIKYYNGGNYVNYNVGMPLVSLRKMTGDWNSRIKGFYMKQDHKYKLFDNIKEYCNEQLGKLNAENFVKYPQFSKTEHPGQQHNLLGFDGLINYSVVVGNTKTAYKFITYSDNSSKKRIEVLTEFLDYLGITYKIGLSKNGSDDKNNKTTLYLNHKHFDTNNGLKHDISTNNLLLDSNYSINITVNSNLYKDKIKYTFNCYNIDDNWSKYINDDDPTQAIYQKSSPLTHTFTNNNYGYSTPTITIDNPFWNDIRIDDNNKKTFSIKLESSYTQLKLEKKSDHIPRGFDVHMGFINPADKIISNNIKLDLDFKRNENYEVNGIIPYHKTEQTLTGARYDFKHDIPFLTADKELDNCIVKFRLPLSPQAEYLEVNQLIYCSFLKHILKHNKFIITKKVYKNGYYEVEARVFRNKGDGTYIGINELVGNSNG